MDSKSREDSSSAKLERSEMSLDQVLTIKDLRAVATSRSPKMYREYFNEGADDLITLRDNENAYEWYKIRPRILINVSNLDSTLWIFGKKIPFPLGFAPSATHKLAHPDGERATSRAAAKEGLPMGLSSYSSTSIEEVVEQGTGNPYIMQITVFKDRARTLKMIRRVERAGFSAIFLTVDSPVLGQRLNEHRNNFKLPDNVGFPNMIFDDDKDDGSAFKGVQPQPSSSVALHGFKSLIRNDRDQAQDWESVIPWLKSVTRLEIWAKGIYTPEDVRMAIKYKLDGVVISNHGGRQLDGTPATVDALRDCAPAAFSVSPDGKSQQRLIQVAVDGGIRKGSDIFKAIALGAQICFVGRVPIWGLAAGGEEGAIKAVQILKREFQTTMALAGCRTIADITRDRLAVLSSDRRLLKL